MRRRTFLKNTAIAAGATGALKVLIPFTASGMSAQKTSQSVDQRSGAGGAAPKEIRSAEYLRRVKAEKDVPGPPVFAESRLSPPVRVSPMSLGDRLARNIIPRHGFCSIAPGATLSEGLTSGNGAMNIELTGDPYAEQVLFHHESLLMPWRRPLEAPKVADIFTQVRQMVLDGKYKEAVEFAFREMDKGPIKLNTFGHPTIPAFLMRLDFPRTASVKDYLRTVDFESSEANVYWGDERGEWLRRTFTSRPDNVVVQWITAPKGQSVTGRISLADPPRRMRPNAAFKGMNQGSWTGSGESDIQHDFNEQRLIYKCRLDPSTDNSGYAGVTRVVRTGGSARMEDGALVLENASSVMLLTRIEWFADYSEDKVEALRLAVEQLSPEYDAMVERHRKVQAEAFNRVTVDFGGASQHGLSSEELLADQRSRPDYSPALLQKIFEMGRYWFILTSGKYPSMAAEVNANINLQISPGVQGDLREGMEAYFNWMESLAPDFRVNARNIFGMRGTHYSLLPDKGIGVAYHYANASNSGEMWPHPYWISAGGWCCRPFWDHYLVTGDLEFLRKRVVPALKELALFYEDFLTVTDKDGKYIFVPSFSPENWPANANTSSMLVINATMDIAVCREVLTNLINASEILGSDSDNVPKWKAMLEKLPPYLLEKDGTLKEWAWPTLQENYNQRHVSHLYGAWPGDEIDPDRTPKLALAAMMADRRRVPERLAAHGRCHRALVGARLKDRFMVDTELRQLIEQGYIGTTLRCSHDPYAWPMPDAQGGILTIIMEMLAYSRPGEIELLPALPPSLVKGKIRGMLARTFARIDELAWDMQARTVDVTITSVKKQDVTLIARYGIEELSAPAGVLAGAFQPETANCDLHLPEKKPVELHLKIGHHQPLEWVDQVM
ncbi:MAG TPA: glycoside hydrolase N-terminal domain-containing protein [Bacteroidota bacterium]|nr:glycoside hydrolase N-terminal domain-containing protein [Bacteroidota bacterium]